MVNKLNDTNKILTDTVDKLEAENEKMLKIIEKLTLYMTVTNGNLNGVDEVGGGGGG